MSAESIRFLTLENVLQIHANTIQEEGGAPGVRERGLLESAVAMPQSRFGGEYLHAGLAEMAAATLYHLCQNHAFLDGNKRTAAFSTVLFLYLNGVPKSKLPDQAELERVTLSVESGQMSKSALTGWMRTLEF